MQRIFTNRLLPIKVIAAAVVILISITGCKKQSGKPSARLPELTTNAPTDITAISASCGGFVINEGGQSTWRRGISWDTITNSNVGSFGNWNGVAGTGNFSFPIRELKPLTKYYVRAWAENSAGIAYGNEVSFSTPALVIGGKALDGIVFEIDSTGLHGLACASADQAESGWSNGSYLATGAIYTESGRDNTGLILNAEGSMGTYAALICVNYGDWSCSCSNGFMWYLPSKDELNKLYNQRNVIGGFSNGDYWSSTEFDTTKAWLKDFSDGKETASDKAIVHHVRAIRTF